MKPKSIHVVLQEAMQKICGGHHYHRFNRSKLKDGAVIYRMTAYGWNGLWRGDDGKIYVSAKEKGEKPLEVTHDDLQKEYKEQPWRTGYESFWDWEWYVLSLGKDKVEEFLTDCLAKEGITAEVSIGGRDGRGDGYSNSIAVRLSKSKYAETDAASLLMKALPPVGSSWPRDQRQRWVEHALSLFDLMYGE